MISLIIRDITITILTDKKHYRNQFKKIIIVLAYSWYYTYHFKNKKERGKNVYLWSAHIFVNLRMLRAYGRVKHFLKEG